MSKKEIPPSVRVDIYLCVRDSREDGCTSRDITDTKILIDLK